MLSFCPTAFWDCFGNAITSFIGYYEVERESGSKYHPKNSPAEQYDTTLTQPHTKREFAHTEKRPWDEVGKIPGLLPL